MTKKNYNSNNMVPGGQTNKSHNKPQESRLLYEYEKLKNVARCFAPATAQRHASSLILMSTLCCQHIALIIFLSFENFLANKHD